MMLKYLDAYILTRLQQNRLSRLTRLLYALRRRWLCWHVTPSGRVVRMSRYGQAVLKEHPVAFYRLDTARRVDEDASVDEGVKRARNRVYGRVYHE